MKQKYFITSAIILASLFCGSEALAQHTTYSRSSVTHRAGQWYRDSYQREHPRSMNATNPDGFDEDNNATASERGMLPHPTASGKRIQKVHEYREDVYINPGRTKSLIVPSNYKDSYSVFFTYQRWYNYTTDSNVDDNWISFPGRTGSKNTDPRFTDYQYNMADGTYSGSFITDDTEPSHSLWKVQVKAPNNFSGTPYVLACDMSDYTDYDKPSRNGDTFNEPTLGQRVIYTIYPASVIKNKMSTSTYYEEHDIHVPNKHIGKTLEQVALDMAANNYFVPGENRDCEELSVALDKRYNNISLATTSLSGQDRKISFIMSGTIADGTVVYINVTKDNYKIAQFKLTFDANTEGLEESEITQIENAGDRNELYFRTNSYLEKYFNLLTKLDFDYDNVDGSHLNSAGSRGDYYPYPLEWGTSSYGYWAGSSNFEDNYPQWGQYGITTGNGYRTGNNTLLPGSRFHLYVDANQYPGTVCELPFSTKFCQSSRLYVTAWIKSVNADNDDAGVLFILKGVNDNGTTQILHTQSSGQIHTDSNTDSPWYQVYFEFTSPGYTFDNYVLEVFNNCASTSGGDFCIDDIRVYISPLQVNANTTTPLCSTEKEAEVQVDINYELLLDRLGQNEVTSSNQAETYTGYYSFVNKYAFDQAINASKTYQEAFEEALVHGNGVYMGSSSDYFGTIKFSNYFQNNNGNNGMVNSNGTGSNRKILFTADVAANQTGDDFTTLIAGDEYYIVFTQTDITGFNVGQMAEAYEMNDTECGIKGVFTVEGPLIVNVDGEVVTDAATACIGQQPLVDVEMQDEDGQIVKDAVFDWYFGTYAEFIAEHTEDIAVSTGTTKQHSLQEALERFRINYPDVNAVSDNIVPVINDNDENQSLYQEDIDLIKQLNEDFSVGGLNPKLTLSASRNLSIRLVESETYVVLIPVGAEPTESEEGSALKALCWEPTQLLLHAQDGAPLLDVGRDDANYEKAGDYGVKIRIGKGQYDAMQRLDVFVRNPRLDDNSSTTISQTNDMNVYLNWTDDPRYLDELVQVGGWSKVVGKIAQNFRISGTSNADAMYVPLSFNKDEDFQPREGYQYSFAIQFTTTAVTETPDCYGQLVIPTVIVPDYEVWIGKPDGNWNDDSNWRRANPEEIKKLTGYMTNDENGTSQGYVPLATTCVVIPTEQGVQLYQPGQLQGAGGILDLDINKGTLASPTANIEYDMCVNYNDNLRHHQTGLYKSNSCYYVHFDARGQMLNSHLLSYNRAWTNVEVPTEQWTTVATPLQGVFTGDWYTNSTGKESAEYFTDLTFGNGNDRLQPYVLQRSWNGHAVINDEGTGVEDGGHNMEAHTSDVTWSSTYNDVDIQNKPGEGFSILVGKGSQTTDGGKVEFRLPKEDTKYDGFDATFQRRQVNTGLLFTDNLKQTESTTVSVSPSHDGKYALIGNPFTSSLDMEKFFEANTVLDKVYWTASGDPYTALEDEEEWITSNGQSTAVVPPYTAFYVRLINPSTSLLNITFARDMAIMPMETSTETQGLKGLTLEASSEKGNSSAMLRYAITAENGFVENEDVQLMTESTGVTTPLVYTVAGDMASNINQIKDLQKIPLGLFAAEDAQTTLTFKGVSALKEPTLYDALQNSSTPITEGMTLDINGSSHGRYYIFALGEGDGTTTGIDEITSTEDEVKVTSPVHRQVMVTANSGIEGISIYSANGTLLRRVSPKGEMTCTIDGVASGVAVVIVKTASNNETSKIIIK